MTKPQRRRKEAKTRRQAERALTKPPPKSLMDLPPELRIDIFEYVLVEQGPIQLTSPLNTPPLLSVNRIIREEANEIWWKKNKFDLMMYDCDARQFAKFQDHCRTFEACRVWRVDSICYYERPHWSNLMAWCEMVFYNKCSGTEENKLAQGNTLGNVVALCHDVVLKERKEQKGDWAHCLLVLEAMRGLAGLVDSSWLEDL